MEITEVTITEDATVTYYSNLVPSGEQLSRWLGVLVQKLALGNGDLVRILTSEGGRVISRNNITVISITMAST